SNPLPFSLNSLIFFIFHIFSPFFSQLSPKEGNQKQNKPFCPLPQGAVVVAAAAASCHCRRRFVSSPPPLHLVVAAADSSHRRRRSVARRRVPPPSLHRRAFAIAAVDEALIRHCR
ncbi:hypothetical protein LINPERHAP1_LOCUS17065, partial [Linum perenne]